MLLTAPPLADIPVQSPIALELAARALRQSLWLSLYHAQQLHLHQVEHRLTTTLVEIDELLELLDSDV